MDVALATVEVLEAVLLELDTRTLLVSTQRVSKYWHALIEHSPRIQQALFFLPVRAGTDRSSSSEGCVPVTNPLLHEKSGRFFFDVDGDYGYIHRSDAFGKLPWATSILNPIYVDRRVGESYFPHWTAGSPQDQRARQAFTRHAASWRKMLVSQPPPPLLAFTWLEDHDGWEILMGVAKPRLHGARRAGLDCSGDGVRMGMLYDLIQQHVAHHERNSIWFPVTWHRPDGPFVTRVCRDACQKLLRQTHVVAEFLHRLDDGIYPPDPPEAYRSRNFEEVAVETEILRLPDPKMFRLPSWFLNAIFYW
jgi:hypothetical protein